MKKHLSTIIAAVLIGAVILLALITLSSCKASGGCSGKWNKSYNSDNRHTH